MNQNHVSVIGRLTADPRIVTVKSGQICNLNVAVNGRPKKEGGERPVEYIPVTVFGKQAVNCGSNLVKGQEVRIDGMLHYHKQKIGEKTIPIGEVWANYVEFGSKPKPALAKAA